MELSAERWAAVRALMEGAPPTPGRVATAIDVHHTTVSKKAAAGNWRAINWRHSEAVARHTELVRRLMRAFPTAYAGKGEPDWMARVGPVEPHADEPDAGSETEAGLPEAFAELDGASPGELAARMVNLAARSAARILVRAERRGGVLSRNDVDTLGAIARFSERMEARASEQRAAQGEQDDEENAALLDRIQERVFSLAYELAERIVADRDAESVAGERVDADGADEPAADSLQ